jgi:RimJ/RimL family protein N-acetyltransferase
MSRANHIVFRGFRLRDAEALISWASSADELLQWSGPHFSFPLDKKQLRAYAKSASEKRQLISGVLEGTDAVVAHAELNLLPEHELGQIRRVIVAPELRGQGIGRELIQWLVNLSFVDLRLNRLELVVFDFNERARRCYEAAGFKEEGRAKQARRASGDYWDLIYMAQLRGWYDRPGELTARDGSEDDLYVRR